MNEGKMNVVSQFKVYCNGGSKLVATTGDRNLLSMSFGSCSAKNNAPCAPSITWQNYYDDVQIAHSYNILTMNSKGQHGIVKTRQKYPILKSFLSYSSGNVKYRVLKLETQEQHRYYIDIDALACFIGAMIEESIEDLYFSGFSIMNGNTAGGSSSHLNGMVGDMGYFGLNNIAGSIHITLAPDATYPTKNPSYDYDREKKFCEALYKFGFAKYSGKLLLSENVSKIENKKQISLLLPHSQHYAKGNVRHYHHLHIQGLKLSEVIQIKT